MYAVINLKVQETRIDVFATEDGAREEVVRRYRACLQNETEYYAALLADPKTSWLLQTLKLLREYFYQVIFQLRSDLKDFDDWLFDENRYWPIWDNFEPVTIIGIAEAYTTIGKRYAIIEARMIP